jgi:hypothetical protein
VALEALPRTKAALEEAMRLFPPVPFMSRQALAEDRIDLGLDRLARRLVLRQAVERPGQGVGGGLVACAGSSAAAPSSPPARRRRTTS